MGSLSANYDTDFYRSFTPASAQIVVPIICSLLPGVKSVVDYGCGPGLWLREFMRAGMEVQGYDFGDAAPENMAIPPEHFAHLDITTFVPQKKYDLAVCLEVAEHIPPENAGQLVNLLCASSDIVVFSAAVPLQGGNCHLNEQWPAFWIERFKKKGFICFDVIRPIIWNDYRIDRWYRNNMLLFIHETTAARFSDLSKMKSFYGYSVVSPDMFLFYRNLLEQASLKWVLKRGLARKLEATPYGRKFLLFYRRIKGMRRQK